jgi:hypothetical protein
LNNISENGLDMITYPNPFSSQTTVRFNLEQSSEVSIDIYDITGKLARKIDAGTYTPGRNSIVIQKENLQRGIYLMKLNAGAESGISKIIIK